MHRLKETNEYLLRYLLFVLDIGKVFKRNIKILSNTFKGPLQGRDPDKVRVRIVDNGSQKNSRRPKITTNGSNSRQC